MCHPAFVRTFTSITADFLCKSHGLKRSHIWSQLSPVPPSSSILTYTRGEDTEQLICAFTTAGLYVWFVYVRQPYQCVVLVEESCMRDQ